MAAVRHCFAARRCPSVICCLDHLYGQLCGHPGPHKICPFASFQDTDKTMWQFSKVADLRFSFCCSARPRLSVGVVRFNFNRSCASASQSAFSENAVTRSRMCIPVANCRLAFLPKTGLSRFSSTDADKVRKKPDRSVRYTALLRLS